MLDYGGDARRLRDILRGSVVCETVDELDVVVDALRAVKDVEVISSRTASATSPRPGYRDVNINIDYHGFVVELQLHLSEVLQVSDRQHVAYFQAARELDLMGVLEKPDASLSDTAPIETKVAYNLARFGARAAQSIYRDPLSGRLFTFKGRVSLSDAPIQTRGVASGNPTLSTVFMASRSPLPTWSMSTMLARAAGLFGEAAKDGGAVARASVSSTRNTLATRARISCGRCSASRLSRSRCRPRARSRCF